MLKEVAQWLIANSQYARNEIMFNHESVAILAKHLIKNKTDIPTYVLAGSEDLRAILPHLSLSKEGEAALIVIRPYVHTMGLFIRKQKEVIRCFLFDSQSWGVRYYPTRLIIDQLNQYFPQVDIILSGDQLQNPNMQRGCTAHTLTWLLQCAETSETFFDDIDKRDTLNVQNVHQEHYAHTKQLVAQSFPPTQDQTDCYLNDLEQFIQQYYSHPDAALNFEKIDAVAAEMQGLHLISPRLFDHSYSIQVKEGSLHIQFKNKHDALHNNFFLYSAEKYPLQVDISTCKILLADTNEMKVCYNPQTYTLTYSAPLDTIRHQFTALLTTAEKRKNLFTQHMRQQSALLSSIHAVQEAIDLSKICKNHVGGFDQHQTQLALKYLFRDNPRVYIPTIDELEALSLDELKKAGYQYIGFSHATTTQHSHHALGVWIVLGQTTHIIQIYNSLPEYEVIQQKNSEAVLSLLHLKQTGGDCEVQVMSSPYFPQEDTWSCSVYVIAHLLQASKMSLHHPSLEKLDVEKLVVEDYRAYRYQEHENDRHHHYKAILLKEIVTIPALNHLNTFITEELKDHYQSMRPLREMANSYCNSSFNINHTIVKLASLYADYRETTFKSILQQSLSTIPTLTNEPLPKQGLQVIDLLEGEINFILADKENKKQYLQKLIEILIANNDNSIVIEKFLNELNYLEYCEPIQRLLKTKDSNQFVFSLITKIVNHTFKLEEYMHNEDKRKKKEQAVREARKDKIKKIVSNELLHHSILNDASLYRCIEKLYQVDPILIDDKILELMIKQVANRGEIITFITTLHQTNPALINEQNIQLITNHVLYAKQIADAIIILYQANPALINERNRQLIVHDAQYADLIALALTKLHQTDPALLNEENYQLIMNHTRYAVGISYVLALQQNNPALANEIKCQLITTNNPYAENINRALEKLYRANSALTNEQNLNFIMTNAQYAIPISHALVNLYQTNAELVSKENGQLIVNYAPYGWEIGNALYELYQANPKLVDEQHFKLIVNHAPHAKNIAHALVTLHQANPALVNDQNRQLIENFAPHASTISNAIAKLHQINSTLVSDVNCQLIATYATKADDICHAIEKLHQTNPTLVNDQNFKLIVNRATYANDIADALIILHLVDPALVNNQNRQFIARNTTYVRLIAHALATLHQADPALVNDQNRQLIAHHAEFAGDISHIFSVLRQINPALVNEPLFKLIANHAQDAWWIIYAINILRRINIQLINEQCMTLLADHAQDAKLIADALSLLYKVDPALANQQNLEKLTHPDNINQLNELANGILHEKTLEKFGTDNPAPLTQDKQISTSQARLFAANNKQHQESNTSLPKRNCTLI